MWKNVLHSIMFTVYDIYMYMENTKTEMCADPWEWLKCKKVSIFGDLWRGAFPDVCSVRLPFKVFDLFLESNVMIVANFEIWKHTCCVSLQSCFARFSLAHFSCCLQFYLFDSYFTVLFRCPPKISGAGSLLM